MPSKNARAKVNLQCCSSVVTLPCWCWRRSAQSAKYVSAPKRNKIGKRSSFGLKHLASQHGENGYDWR